MSLTLSVAILWKIFNKINNNNNKWLKIHCTDTST